MNKIPMLEKFAAQSLVEYDGELIFNKEKFAELIVNECLDHIDTMERIAHASNASIPDDYDKYTYLKTLDVLKSLIKGQFGVEK